MKKIRVLHVLQSNQFSGAENVVCQIIDMFKDNVDYEMAYCSPRGQIENVLEERKITYYPIDSLSVRNVKKIIKDYQPTIIHAHDAQASVIATLANRKCEIISQIHGNHLNMRKIGVKSLLVKEMSYVWKKIIWVSQSAFSDYRFRECVGEKSLVLPNIILKSDIERKMKLDMNEYSYDCIVLGRINNIKNPLRAIKVFEQVAKKYPALRVVFVGDGDLYEECKSYIKVNKLENNIAMLGYINNPIKILSGSKILVMTSVYEGTPMSALEAMGIGLPIVSTPTDGMLDLIVQNKTGFLSDDDEQLANKIIDLLSDVVLYSEMQENTKHRFEELMNVDRYRDSLLQIYCDAIKDKGRESNG